MPTLSIILPCRNEESNLDFVLRSILKAFGGVKFEVILVDNASTDRSFQIAQQFTDATDLFSFEVVRENRLGYGQALRTGFDRARGEWVLMMDADGTYPADEARRLFNLALKSHSDFVLGDRIRGQIEPRAMPWMHRHVGTPVLSWLLRYRYPSLNELYDCNSGLRILKNSALKTLSLKSQGMELASEMLVEAAGQGLQVRSYPVRYAPSPFQRRGHLRPFRDGLRHVLEICRRPSEASSLELEARR